MPNKFLFALVVSLMLGACSSQRALQLPKRWDKNPKAQELLKHIQNRNETIETVNAKADCDAFFQGKKNSFNLTIKMQKDEATWISISPALGIEVARLWLTPDSITVMNKLDKNFATLSYTELSNRLDTDIEFQDLQDLILNKIIKYQAKDKYVLEEFEDYYLISKQINRRVKRNIGLKGVNLKKEEVNILDSNLTLDLKKDKAEEKLMKKDKQLFISSHIAKNDLQFLSQSVLDLASTNQLEVKYGKQLFDFEIPVVSKDLELILSNKDSTISTFNLHFSRFRINEELELRFKISSKYERKKL